MPDHEHGTGRATGPRFAIGAGVNFAFVVAEVIFGVASHSVALVADAAHNFGDVLGLLLAWGATVLARRVPSPTHTYGLRKTTLLATLANAVLLLVAIGGVVWEAVQWRRPSRTAPRRPPDARGRWPETQLAASELRSSAAAPNAANIPRIRVVASSLSCAGALVRRR